MFLNYFKLTIRLLVRNPFFTFINVLGLSVGFAAFFIIWQYSHSELKSDQFHKDWKRIVRLGLKVQWTDDKVNWQESTWGTNDILLTTRIAKEYHEVDAFTTILQRNNFGFFNSQLPDHEKDIFISILNEAGETVSFQETRLAYADSNFFDFFTIPLAAGDESTALTRPESVVLSEHTARKYFGNENPVGKVLHLNQTIPLKVSGVFRDLPRNTHFNFDMLISMERLRNLIPNRSWQFHCYMKLKPESDTDKLAARINKDLKESIKYSAWGGWPYGKAEIYLQSLEHVAFTSYIQDSHQAKSRLVLNILNYASIVILMMAWINYVNLNISSCKKRLKELAARKTVGAKQVDLLVQFIFESTWINLLSLLIAITIVQLVRDPAMMVFHYYIPDWNNISAAGAIISVCVLFAGIFVTGLYPAVVTLKRSPKSLFNNTNYTKNRGVPEPLTMIQFSIAIILIILIFSVSRQINFILTNNIGFSTDQVIVVDLPVLESQDSYSHITSFGSDLSFHPTGNQYTVSQSAPGDNSQNWIAVKRRIDDAGMQVESNGGVDEHFLPFYNIKLLAGRNFLADHPGDSSSIIISEGTAMRLGFDIPETALGENIYVFERKTVKIIGIIKDYKIRPLLHEGYMNYGGKPGLALTYKNFIWPGAQFSEPRKISFRIYPEDYRQSIQAIEKAYSKYFPGTIFNWRFLDAVINGKYNQQKTARNQIILFASLAIVIACLGFLGMIANRVVDKTKEIGIRKVLGARVHQIASVLLTTMVRPLIIGISIGLPVAAYLTEKYLQTFSERITIQWWQYLIPIGMLLMIMLLTIASTLWKATQSSPMQGLRYE